MLSPFLIYIRMLFEIFILDFLAEKKPLQFLKTARGLWPFIDFWPDNRNHKTCTKGRTF